MLLLAKLEIVEVLNLVVNSVISDGIGRRINIFFSVDDENCLETVIPSSNKLVLMKLVVESILFSLSTTNNKYLFV